MTFFFFSILAGCFFFVQVCTAKMNLGDEVDLEDYVSRPDKISAAEVCYFVTFHKWSAE